MFPEINCPFYSRESSAVVEILAGASDVFIVSFMLLQRDCLSNVRVAQMAKCT